MTAKLLQLAHAAHGGDKRITCVVDAVEMLGVEAIRSLVLMPGIFEQAAECEMPEGFGLSRLWEHALKVAEYAKRIVECDTEDPALIDEAYTAGLLHDIGFLIVSTRLPEIFSTVLELRKNDSYSLTKAEREAFGATHADMGGFLLDLWGIPDHIVEAISFHLHPASTPEKVYGHLMSHEDEDEESISTLTAIHVANYLCEEDDPMIPDQAKAEIDNEHLEAIGMMERMEEWWEVCNK
ncbi:MAG TPA: HDOD domain-containing protein [Candidatus Hydrogenedentes bacterium]|nr:HDOD domain-containing protein [Candidatus Hydrogenedentota bacterium]